MMGSDVMDYLIPAIEHVWGVYKGGYVTFKQAIEFERILGFTEYENYNKTARGNVRKPISDEYRELLIKFASPHGKALFAAYLIQRGKDGAKVREVVG